MRILGIDPGMAISGYCALDVINNSYENSYNIITSGSIQTHKSEDTGARLLEIHNDLSELIIQYKPDCASVEKLFFFKNAKTIMPVSEARGVIIMTLKKFDIKVFEYTPLVVKQTITGYGKATKQEVCQMTQLAIGAGKMPKLDDASDAVAIALCHARHIQINSYCQC